MSFVNFETICEQVPLSFCPLLGAQGKGLFASCFARNAWVGGRPFFQGVQVVALLIVSIIIYTITSKFTAVGRKEIAFFFYLYIAATLAEFLVISYIVPPSSPAYDIITAIYIGFLTASNTALMVNGCVGFQWTEDGGKFSMWTIRIGSLIGFVVGALISFFTFRGIAGMSPDKPLLLFIVYVIYTCAAILLFTFLQVILVFKAVDNKTWPLGSLTIGLLLFIIGQAVTLFASSSVCTMSRHNLDGVAFGIFFTLLSVMMLYKYWDTITQEDLEFSLSSKNEWVIKDNFGAAPSLNDQSYGHQSYGQQSYGQQSYNRA